MVVIICTFCTSREVQQYRITERVGGRDGGGNWLWADIRQTVLLIFLPWLVWGYVPLVSRLSAEPERDAPHIKPSLHSAYAERLTPRARTGYGIGARLQGGKGSLTLSHCHLTSMSQLSRYVTLPYPYMFAQCLSMDNDGHSAQPSEAAGGMSEHVPRPLSPHSGSPGTSLPSYPYMPVCSTPLALNADGEISGANAQSKAVDIVENGKQARAKRIEWRRFPDALRYLQGKLAEYQAHPVSGRRSWLATVQEHVVTHWTCDLGKGGQTAGDIREVRE